MSDFNQVKSGFAGLKPTSFNLDNVDAGGTVDLSWDSISEADIRSDYIMTAENGELLDDTLTASDLEYPFYISAHVRNLLGFKLHRATDDPNFTPDGESTSSGNNIADHTVLTSGASSYQDTGLSPGSYFYKLAKVTDF